MCVPHPLQIGVPAWIIQDGNYPEFAVGEQHRFALEFSPRELRATEPSVPSLRLRQGAEYSFSGEVLLHDPNLAILNVGFFCFHDGPLPGLPHHGGFCSGDLYLGIDPFFWFETHSRRPNMPNLFYEWHINKILLETTPWRTHVEPGGRKEVSRVPGSPSFRQVDRTNAWRDDDGNAHYVIVCNQLGPAV